jgi:DNA-binding IclR family transcriptional regulator
MEHGLVGSVSNAIAILRTLASSEPRGVNAIARSLNLSPSSCFNILKTLVAEGVLDFDRTTKAYSMGNGLQDLLHHRPTVAEWTAWLRRALQLIADQSHTSCGLWRVNGSRAILVEVAECSQETRIHISPGQRLPKYIGAMGRCIISQERLAPERIDDILAELRWQVEPNLKQYLADVKSVRASGWAVDDGNYLRGVITVAAAIIDETSRVSHCLTSTGIAGQFMPGDITGIGFRLADLASTAGARLQGD